jgi:hypothetical protein
MPAIDPEKEVSAAEKRMELTMTTLQDETAAYNGRDWQANVEQAAREREKRKAAGLLPEPAPAASPARPQPDEPANPDNPGGYDTPGAVAELVSAFGAEIRARDAVILPAMTRSSEALAAAAAREIPAAPAPVVNFHEGAFRIEHRAGDTHVTVPERSVSVTAPVAPLPPPTRQTIVRDSAGEIASIITRPIGED